MLREVVPHHGWRIDGNHHPHHHLVCTRCRSITDLDLDSHRSGETAWQTSVGFPGGEVHIEMQGICKACSQAETKQHQIYSIETRADTNMLSVGEQFPDFNVTATVSLEKDKEFKNITNEDYSGQVEGLLLLAEGFHLRLPDRDCRVRQAEQGIQGPRRADSGRQHGFRVCPSRVAHPSRDLKNLPFPMLADIKRDLSVSSAFSTRTPAWLSVPPSSSIPRHHPFRLRDRSLGRSQSTGSSARARRAPDRRALPLQLAEGPGNSARLVDIHGGSVAQRRSHLRIVLSNYRKRNVT